MESPSILVRVVPSLKISVSNARPRRRKAVTVRGTMTPPSARVTVKWERRVGRRWRKVQKKRIAVRDGAFKTKVRPPLPGRYRLTISGGGVKRTRRITAR